MTSEFINQASNSMLTAGQLQRLITTLHNTYKQCENLSHKKTTELTNTQINQGDDHPR